MTNELSQKIKPINNNKHIDTLYNSIAGYIHAARNNVVRSVNIEQVKAYWLIGKDIVEEEQKGKKRAGYGEYLIFDPKIPHAVRGEFAPKLSNNLKMN